MLEALQDMYVQNPLWIWAAVAAIFVALDIASGGGKVIAPAVAAGALAFINAAEVRLGAELEFGIFLAVSILGVALSFGLHRKPAVASPDAEFVEPYDTSDAIMATADRTGRLIGRIGRTTGEFANGVGRVWIDGCEWGAELCGNEEVLPVDAPVRVTGVIGGIRLQVRGLMH